MSTRILIVEDDVALARLLQDNLTYRGFAVDCVADGGQALERARVTRPDLVLLDVMLPSLDGFEICRGLGAARERLPVIMLTARTQPQDKVRGLELGADDYLTKPFALEELLARINAVLRRTQPRMQRLVLGDVVVDFARLSASRGRTALLLTPRELDLLRYLAERAHKVVTRDELLQAVWGYKDAPLTRTVDNFVARLRRKIEPDPHHPTFIRTMHGDGYSLVLDG
jgi:two-component system, OmpR family, response regulator MtrA